MEAVGVILGVLVGAGVSVMVGDTVALGGIGVGDSVSVGVNVSVGVKVNVGGKPVVGIGLGVTDGKMIGVGRITAASDFSATGPAIRMMTKTIVRMVNSRKTKLMTL